MKIYRIAQSKYQDVYDLFAEVSEQEVEILREYYRKGGGKQMSWQVVPFPRLRKIWNDYIKYGVVHDTAGLDMIIDIFLTNIVKISAVNVLSGHANTMGRGASEIAEENDLPPIDERNYDFYFTFLNTKYGVPISDYGIDSLFALAEEILNTERYEDKLIIVDQMLNVVHQRGDLASLFVEGGTEKLEELSGYDNLSIYHLTKDEGDTDEEENNELV
jgi:hypothetical protein